MTVDYHELNKIMPPLYVAAPFIHELMDRLIVQLGTYYYIVDLSNIFFSIGLAPSGQEQFVFKWEKWKWTLLVLPQGNLHSPTICHGLVAKDYCWLTVVLFHVVLYHVYLYFTFRFRASCPGARATTENLWLGHECCQDMVLWLICQILRCYLIR